MYLQIADLREILFFLPKKTFDNTIIFTHAVIVVDLSKIKDRTNKRSKPVMPQPAPAPPARALALPLPLLLSCSSCCWPEIYVDRDAKVGAERSLLGWLPQVLSHPAHLFAADVGLTPRTTCSCSLLV